INMASSSSLGRVLTLCKQFQSMFRISPALSSQHCAVNLKRCQSNLLSKQSSLITSSWIAPISCFGQHRAVHTTISRRGLEEFFDQPENWGESTVKSGAPWMAKQLRTKSNEDLHKLWYRFKEYAIPWYMNKRYKRKKFYTPHFVQPHISTNEYFYHLSSKMRLRFAVY
ncbi:hypothetical protein GOODEAATRI_009158, partial [Goodea atripinnis]